ncbi:MAG TPA: HGGxSTG domain-containing protein [Methylobacter sp.]
MSTLEQRKRLKDYYRRSNATFEEWGKRGYQYPPPKHEPMPDNLKDLQCGAKTRAGTPCKQKAIYANGRCKWHGGCSTGAKTEEGKKRSAMNGFCPKKKRSHTS